MKIGILGAGAYGSALGGVLRENHHAVKFYDPAKLPSVSLESVANWASVILIAAPSSVVRILLKELPAETFLKPALVATKGIMDLSVWEQFRYFELISGPGFAEEITRHKHIKLTVAARRALEGDTLVESLLSTSYLKFDKTEDLTGIALLSGLKNLFAIEAGRRGLESDSRDFKDYLATAYRECEQVLLHNGGFVETVRLSAGLGDLALTCGSPRSRNYEFGLILSGHNGLLERESDLRKIGQNLPRKRPVRISRKTALKDAKRFLKYTTVEGVFAAKEIARNGIFIPKTAEILTDILRRIDHAT
ncbi:hypothetical protein IJF89_00680 [Candidatus Saccharibacteria bacterium]|nr:hypothetical protein [Candidatus Saccharibacteria bacterium]